MFWHKYPYTDIHELNLDYILAMIRDMHKEISEFEAVNKITNAGAWDITKQYQAWTIVSDNNMGYISLQAVPSGVAITNTDYWGFIADYDVVISDLAVRLNNLEHEFELYKDLNLIVVTDSYGTTYPEPSGETFIDEMKKVIPNTTSYVYPGDGFLRTSGRGTFRQNFMADTAALSADDRNKIDIILVAAGRNDWPYTKSELLTEMTNFVIESKARFQNAIVMVAFIANGDNNATYGTRSQQFAVYDAFSSCADAGAVFLAGAESILKIPGTMGADYIHPNAAGRRLLGQYLAQGIIDGKCSVRTDEVNVTLPSPSYCTLAVGISSLNEYIENGVATIETSSIVGSAQFTIGSVIIVNQIVTVDMGAITSGVIRYPAKLANLYSGFVAYKKWLNNAEKSGWLNDTLELTISINSDGHLIFILYSSDSINLAELIIPNIHISIPAVYC